MPYRFQREHGPAGTLISDFYPPELWENKFLLFKAKKTNKNLQNKQPPPKKAPKTNQTIVFKPQMQKIILKGWTKIDKTEPFRN